MIDGLRRFGGQMISRLYTDASVWQAEQARLATFSGLPATHAEQYALLRAYYQSNSLYARLSRAMVERGLDAAPMAALRNPAFRVVEFYVAAIWPGALGTALPIRTDNEAIVAPLEQVWAWSNWAARKQVFARTVPMLGDGFIKVVGDGDRGRVYYQLIEPEHVTDFDCDERGYLTYCRIDIPVRVRQGDAQVGRTSTEVYAKADGTYRRWLHQHGAQRPIDELGAPLETTGLGGDLKGIDFVPIVHCPFRDVGEHRGVGAFTLQIDKINEVNRKATRLAQQLYKDNASTWIATATGVDKDGRPMPAWRPPPTGSDGTATAPVITVGDQAFFSFPGGYDLKSTVPQIDWMASLDAIRADMAELQQDLPEMAYWQIPEVQGDASGRALRVKLLPAMSRAEEARANLEDALIRADQMALTIGVAMGLFDTSIGAYENPDPTANFDHTFAERDAIPLSDLEQAEADVQKATAAKLKLDLGVSKRQVQEELGYDDDEIARMQQEREADQAALDEAMGALLDRQPGATVPVVPANGRPVNGQVPPNANGGPGG